MTYRSVHPCRDKVFDTVPKTTDAPPVQARMAGTRPVVAANDRAMSRRGVTVAQAPA